MHGGGGVGAAHTGQWYFCVMCFDGGGADDERASSLL